MNLFRFGEGVDDCLKHHVFVSTLRSALSAKVDAEEVDMMISSLTSVLQTTPLKFIFDTICYDTGSELTKIRMKEVSHFIVAHMCLRPVPNSPVDLPCN